MSLLTAGISRTDACRLDAGHPPIVLTNLSYFY